MDVGQTGPIVVLGSSTAAGWGVSTPDSSWVKRYQKYLNKTSKLALINLAKGGYTTYQILPTGMSVPAGLDIRIDSSRNVTKALTYHPYAIIINMPSNDAAHNFPVSIQLTNFDTIIKNAATQGVKTWICTPQPRNFSKRSQVNLQFELLDSIEHRYGDSVIDFWHGFAMENGFIRSEFDSGDGIHMNDLGHRLLVERVRATRLESLATP